MTVARQIAATVIAVTGLSVLVAAQTTRPGAAEVAEETSATAPATTPADEVSEEASDVLDDMFAEDPMNDPSSAGTALRADPIAPSFDVSSGSAAVDPTAPTLRVMREGTFLVDRVGRVERSRDGSLPMFIFESDGDALQDPPVMLMPNLKLMALEDALDAAEGESLRFRITGELTEYRGRNYVLLQKVIVVQ
ncbi:MAG: hypothetical protein AAGD32_07490 [Planctomycetota bacterium]